MRVCIADTDKEALQKAGEELASLSPNKGKGVLTSLTNVAEFSDVQRLKDEVFSTFGEVCGLFSILVVFVC